MLKPKHILASMIYFDSDKTKSTHTVLYFDWKTVIYIYGIFKLFLLRKVKRDRLYNTVLFVIARHIFGREPSNDYFIKIFFLLSKWFQTRRF